MKFKIAICLAAFLTFVSEVRAENLASGEAPVVGPSEQAAPLEPVGSLSGTVLLEEPWKLQPVLTLGAAILFEKTNDRRFENSVLPPLLGLGMRLDQDFSRWTARLEYSADESLDGNETLSVRRRRQSSLAWVTRDFGLARGWVPYVGLAGGFVRGETVTVLSGVSETNVGNWLGAFAGSVGFRADWSERVTARAELRYESAAALKTNDARSGVAVYLESSF